MLLSDFVQTNLTRLKDGRVQTHTDYCRDTVCCDGPSKVKQRLLKSRSSTHDYTNRQFVPSILSAMCGRECLRVLDVVKWTKLIAKE